MSLRTVANTATHALTLINLAGGGQTPLLPVRFGMRHGAERAYAMSWKRTSKMDLVLAHQRACASVKRHADRRSALSFLGEPPAKGQTGAW